MAKKILLAVITLLLLYGVYRLVTTSEPMITGTYSCHTEKEEYYFGGKRGKRDILHLPKRICVP